MHCYVLRQTYFSIGLDHVVFLQLLRSVPGSLDNLVKISEILVDGIKRYLLIEPSHKFTNIPARDLLTQIKVIYNGFQNGD